MNQQLRMPKSRGAVRRPDAQDRKSGLGPFAIASESRRKPLLVPSPGVAKPKFGYNLRKAV
jgi:hypothetical protein